MSGFKYLAFGLQIVLIEIRQANEQKTEINPNQKKQINYYKKKFSPKKL